MPNPKHKFHVTCCNVPVFRSDSDTETAAAQPKPATKQANPTAAGVFPSFPDFFFGIHFFGPGPGHEDLQEATGSNQHCNCIPNSIKFQTLTGQVHSMKKSKKTLVRKKVVQAGPTLQPENFTLKFKIPSSWVLVWVHYFLQAFFG